MGCLPNKGRWLLVAGVLAGMWGGGSGCVAINVGKPEVFQHTETVRDADRLPTRTFVDEARIQLRQRKGSAEVSILADIREERDWRKVERTTTVRKQKRLAFGLFPGAAELVLMPDGALESAMTIPRTGYTFYPRYKAYYGNAKPALKHYAEEQILTLLAFCGTVQGIDTVWALLAAPFGQWECGDHDFLELAHYRLDVPDNGQLRGDASESPKLQALAAFPKKVRERIGVQTCYDEKLVGHLGISHFALLGFHKYLAVFVEPPGEGEDVEVGRGVETSRRKVEIEGPYEAELSIPGLGYVERKEVPPGACTTVFMLPETARDGRYEANVTIHDCSPGGGGKTADMTRNAIRRLMGQAGRFELELRVPERSHWIGNDRRGTVRSGGWKDSTSGAMHRYEILAITPSRNGGYSVRVKVLDSTRRSEAIHDIETDVRRRIREDYAARHPGVRADEIHEHVEIAETDRKGEVLKFEGWAFSAHALAEGWQYDEATRRGEVRVLLSEGLPQERATAWARENIGAIVSDKTVVSTPGTIPGTGTAFRCTETRFENGILCIGFEVYE